MTENGIAKTVVDTAANGPKNFNTWPRDELFIRLGIVDGLVRKADRKMDDRNIFLSSIFLSS